MNQAARDAVTLHRIEIPHYGNKHEESTVTQAWLIPETALIEARAKLSELGDATRRKLVISYNPHLANAISEIDAAAEALVISPFTHSVGVVFPDAPNERETWYICGSKVAGYFADRNVIPWTHWLGQVATKLRNAIDHGETPTLLRYGPQGKEQSLPVGPLVDYFIADGRVEAADFYGDSKVGVAEITAPVPEEMQVEVVVSSEDVSEIAPVESEYGLKTIIQTLDLDQDDQIRGPMEGVFVLTGGPGVGKTTVALHRIPYLILEQKRSDSWTTQPEDQSPLYFTADSTLVVVWKEHLVSYLRNCVQQLVDGFPDRNVRHIDRWVNDVLRGYVNLGAGKNAWRLQDNEPDWMAAIKSSFDEQHIRNFLKTDHPGRRAAESAMRAGLPREFSVLLTKRLDELRRLPRLPFGFASPQFTVAAYENLLGSFLNRLLDPNEAAARLSENQQTEVRQIRERIRDGFREALNELSRYTELLFDFYRSDIALDAVRKSHDEGFIQQYLGAVAAQQEASVLSRSDTYLLIWFIHLITQDAASRAQRTKPLAQYSHIVVDEAQYYEPLVLRLFGELADLPKGVLTIVGDLEQRISTDRGLVSWTGVGLDLGTDRVSRLVTSYRWSEEVFEFLEIFHRMAGITETLNRPLKWRVFGGRSPEILTLEDHEVELDFVARRISDLRKDPHSRLWTVTVVVPDQLVEATRKELVYLLESYFVEARWATGEDVKESVDRVIVTDYHSIIGLEFDCIFAIGMNHRFSAESRADIQSAWVALTRAKRFICVTRSEKDGLFDSSDFEPYHKDACEYFE